ncbi:MAG TPA: ATP-binding cassette domain-containing protein [Mycobacteriales bacterium]|jgi:iron complex transport system ATP-binding protein|nr:ATP-binding cassette domain-containing protein [Mycobacteriales bacterium]
MSVLEIDQADVWFADGPHVLRGVSLTIREGEHWALIGPNGAGKSTLLALASAQRFPSRGTVRILDREMGRVDLRELRQSIGIVDVRLRLPAELTVERYVETGATQTVQWLRPVGEAARERVAELIVRFGLSDLRDRSIAVCSQGERGRARLARSLVAKPALLLLDEPASGLDLPGRADLLAAIESTARAEPLLASITVAHHLEELPSTTTHVALMREGVLVGQGDVALLGDEAALSACFGRAVRAYRIDGRWFAIS